MTSTIFNEAAYDDGLRDAIAKVMDEWGFRYPGIADVEHVYFYAATSATPELVHRYFHQAYELGWEFGLPAAQRKAALPPAA
jgi:NAD(P)H dehydrogenase (quinone)